jgi:hypothetical protein
MKIKGLFIALLLAAVVVYFLVFWKGEKKSLLETEIDKLQESRVELAEVNMANLSRAILSFQASEGNLPASLSELSRAGILTAGAADVWGKAIKYERLSENSFRLTSAGPDRTFDTADDIVKDY